MKKSIEMKQKMQALRDEVKVLFDKGDYEAAEAKAGELNKMTAAYNTAMALENAAFSSMGGGVPVGNTATPAELKKAHNQAFNKAILGRQLSDSEKAYAMTLKDAIGTPGQAEGTPAKGGYLVPEEQINKILEWRRNRIALKNDCDVVPVSTYTGTIPTADTETGALVNFDELSSISEVDKDFAQIEWKLKSYGTIVPMSEELLADTNVDLVGFISKRMAYMGVNAENAAIFSIMDATELTQTGTDYKAILKALNTKLDAAISAASTIYTDAVGFDYLDELEDKNGRPLLTPSYEDPAAKMFRGHPVVVLPSNLEVGSTDKKIVLYVGSLADAVKFFDRQGITMATDYSAGFTSNKVLLRAIERFDVKAADTKALVKVTINIPQADAG